MTVFQHLFRGYRRVYAWFWGVMTLVFIGLMLSFEMAGPWIADDEHTSAWGLISLQAPGWFLFVVAIIWATMALPVAVAHGVTRKAFCVGAAWFGLLSAVGFGLVMTAGHLLEYEIYQRNGILTLLTAPYPVPTVRGTLWTIVSCAGFLIGGWLIGLAFYRLPVWAAILLIPLFAVPAGGGLLVPYGAQWPGGRELFAAIAIGAGTVAAYLLARTTPIRPRKA